MPLTGDIYRCNERRVHIIISSSTMIAWDDEICNEFVRAIDGCPLGDPDMGYMVTERAAREQQKVRLHRSVASRSRVSG